MIKVQVAQEDVWITEKLKTTKSLLVIIAIKRNRSRQLLRITLKVSNKRSLWTRSKTNKPHSTMESRRQVMKWTDLWNWKWMKRGEKNSIIGPLSNQLIWVQFKLLLMATRKVQINLQLLSRFIKLNQQQHMKASSARPRPMKQNLLNTSENKQRLNLFQTLKKLPNLQGLIQNTTKMTPTEKEEQK